jgi:GGDEF domain-containing protein
MRLLLEKEYFTMDNQALRDGFRHQLTNVHALTVLTVSLLEIIGYMILVASGIEFFSLRNHYLWYGVVFPIIVNAITHFIARAIVNRPGISRDTFFERADQTLYKAKHAGKNQGLIAAE